MDFKKAKAAAKNLADRLGPDYTPQVHENLGWHYRATKGHITVREEIVRDPENDGYPAYYTANIEPGASVRFAGGSMGLGVQIFARGQTPTEAVENVLRKRDEDIALLKQIIETLKAVK